MSKIRLLAVSFYFLLLSNLNAQVFVSIHYEKKNIHGSDIHVNYYYQSIDTLFEKFDSKICLCEDQFFNHFGIPVLANGTSEPPCNVLDTLDLSYIDTVLDSREKITRVLLDNKDYLIEFSFTKVFARTCTFFTRNRYWGYPIQIKQGMIFIEISEIVAFEQAEKSQLFEIKLGLKKCKKHSH